MSEPVGSVGEETIRLLRALGATSAEQTPPADAHTCSTSWCPVCQVADFVRDHPEHLAAVATSAGALVTALRDLVEAAGSASKDSA